MGDEKVPNLLIYENAEGSLGALERLVLEPASYHAVVKRAYEICYGRTTPLSEEERAKLIPADYTNLLNYYNQPYHQLYNPQIQISAESETKRSIFREKDKTKRSKKESAQHSKSRNKSFVMTSVSAL